MARDGDPDRLDPEVAASWQVWAQQHAQFLAVVYAAFELGNDWPRASELQRRLEREAIDIDVASIALAMPPELGFFEHGRPILTPLGLSFYPGARRLLDDYLAALRLAYARYRSNEPQPRLTASDLGKALSLDPDRCLQVSRLLLREGPGLGSGGGDSDGEWHREVTEQIRILRDVENPRQLAARVAISRAPGRVGAKEDPQATERESRLGAVVGWLRAHRDELLVTLVAGAVLVLLAFGLNELVGGDDAGPDGDDASSKADDSAPIAINVDPHSAASEPAVFNMTPTAFVFSRPLRDVGRPPGSSCRRWRSWALDRGGADAGVSFVRLVVQAREQAAVYLDRLAVETKRRPLTAKTRVICFTGGAQPNVIRVFVDLDHRPPLIRYARPEQWPPQRRGLNFALRATETVLVEINARSRRCDCRWTASMHLVANGQRLRVPISDRGRAFRTSGVGPAKSFLWTQGRWAAHR